MLFKFGKLDALCLGALLVSTRVAIQTSALNTLVSLNINCTLVFSYNAFMLSLNLLLCLFRLFNDAFLLAVQGATAQVGFDGT